MVVCAHIVLKEKSKGRISHNKGKNMSDEQKEKLRKKFIELCNEDTPMIRRACASKLG